jgi:hypothetical protein
VSDRRRAFDAGLERLTGEVFAAHPELRDHRADFGWLTGCLGDPCADVWLIAENPSLTQVRKAQAATVESQWSVSPGDLILRDALVSAGLKEGGPLEPGGWKCWITDVIKSADIVVEWRATPLERQRTIAEAWAPVLRYELEQGRPKQIIVLGGKADGLLKHLEKKRLLPPLPPRTRIHHYSYIGSRPDGAGRGPGHPERVAEWTDGLAEAARVE